jgi:DNA-binding NarL/FixJ family response regulator
LNVTVRLRVAIADDQELARAGLRGIIEAEPDLEVVGEAADGEAAVLLAIREAPDVFLMDVRMPKLDGIEATARIAGSEVASTVKVLVLTTFDVDEYAYRAIKAGASGFLLKDIPAEDLLAAVRQVGRGSDALLAPSVTRRLIEQFAAGRPSVQARAGRLSDITARELEVFRLVAAAMSNSEIAHQLNVSETTVKTHVQRILMKLELRNRVQAVVLAYELGIVTPGVGNASLADSQKRGLL